MTDLAPRPRTTTELVDAAIQLYRLSPAQFIVVTALTYVPWLVIRLLLRIGIEPEVPRLGSLLPLAVGSLLTYGVVSGAVTQIARDVYLGRSPDAAGALRLIVRRLPTLLAATLLKLVFVLLAALLLLVPALYPVARFFAVAQAVVLEGRGAGEALARSSELSRGLKLHILGTLFLLFSISIAMAVGVALFITLVENRVLLQVVSTALSIVVYPLFSITETLLYYDTRIRKEGFDVELLAERSASGTYPAHAST